MISTRHTQDPRLEALFPLEDASKANDLRPMVKRPPQGLSGWAFACLALLGGILLFWVLESRRQQPATPAVRPGATDLAARSYEPPPLYIPPTYVPSAPPSTLGQAVPPPVTGVAPPATVQASSVQQRAPLIPAPAPTPYASPAMTAPPVAPISPPRVAAGPILVADAAEGSAAGPAQPAIGGTSGAPAGMPAARVRAGALANPSGTVPQGAMISAILETALDSTKAGFARALVSRNIHGFDGSRVLIPRGSRLIGEYGAEVAPTQKRAGIIWTRLIRPDGLTIELQSPATDPLGRGGVAASVNTHLFQRFANALLRTTMDIGAAVASRSSRAPVLVAVPGSSAGQVATTLSPAITPTLRVPAGRGISVFVARDLDFGSERPR